MRRGRRSAFKTSRSVRHHCVIQGSAAGRTPEATKRVRIAQFPRNTRQRAELLALSELGEQQNEYDIDRSFVDRVERDRLS